MKLDVVLACISYIYIYYTHFQMPKPYKPSNHPTVFCRPAYLQGLRTCRCRRTSPLPLRWSYPRSPAWCVHTPPGMQRSKKQIPQKNKFHDIPNQKIQISRTPMIYRFHKKSIQIPSYSQQSFPMGGFPIQIMGPLWLAPIKDLQQIFSRCFPWKMNTQTTSGI